MRIAAGTGEHRRGGFLCPLPGNAGSNTAADHIEAVRLALAQLPKQMRGQVLIRADSGGGTHEFLAWLTQPGRRLHYSVGFPMTDDLQAAILAVPKTAWTPAYGSERQVRPGAWVAELTGLRNLPLHGYAQNQIWTELVAMACELLAWTQMLALPGEARRWEPKRLRLRIFTVAGRITRGGRRLRLRLAAHWPWATQITAAVRRLQALEPG
jgi:hypothetical protein